MADGISADDLVKSLSNDAKVILGGYFGVLGMPGKSKLVFGMKVVRPTDRAEIALSELVKAGALSRKELPNGGVEYVVQLNCEPFGRWLDRNKAKGKWDATERVVS